MLINQSIRSIGFTVVLIATAAALGGPGLAQDSNPATSSRLDFQSLPDLPDKIGVAGPIVGVVNDTLIVAGGANFAAPDDLQLWDLPKLFHDRVWIFNRDQSNGKVDYRWQAFSESDRISAQVAYSAVVNCSLGVLCFGGENTNGPQKRAFLLSTTVSSVGKIKVLENDLGVPDLPLPCTAGGAAIVNGHVYVVAGQVVEGDGSKAASRIVWRLDLNQLGRDLDRDVNAKSNRWERIVAWPDDGPRRMFPLVAAQHDGFVDRLYVLGGRFFPSGSDTSDLRNLQFLSDGWTLNPSRYEPSKFNPETGEYRGNIPWKRIEDSPVPLTAGTAVPFGPAHIIVPAAATGEILKRVLDSDQEMRDFAHPGFPKMAYSYHSITDRWVEMGRIPTNQVTTPAVRWGDEIFLVSGETKPRVRSNKVWKIKVRENSSAFGIINMSVVVVYLIAMVAVGVFFTFRNQSTDDYFRGGKSLPWWAAGCSIFATMLSSITYMAIPAKAFAQDWVYAVGSLLILAVAPIAVYIALPFYRRIDATSAYEYLERRFNRTARLIGSGSFSLFHIFRMGIVLALAALALASITPLTPIQCVCVMGVLSIVYCTLGGIEAVVWTDTLQTFVLLGGAILCLAFALAGSDSSSLSAAIDSRKFDLANIDFGSTSFMIMAIWVVVLGGIGQNVSSYTADQAVVQRYMTTPSKKLAARSIWLNGLMAIPAAVIFFGMGTAFWMFYRSNPEKLDPTISADRIMPLFISQELPVGLAGLVVAGIFAAAQSTVSTSMNSGATTIVTDFIRPLNVLNSEQAYLWLARLITLGMGIAGTLAGLLFVNPEIKSLFDQFIGILGMFLGVLAGLFALGAMTRRANGKGSLLGAGVSIALMISIFLARNETQLLGMDVRTAFEALGSKIYLVHSYLYAFIGMTTCFVVGYFASLFFTGEKKSLVGLTWWESPDSESSNQ